MSWQGEAGREGRQEEGEEEREKQHYRVLVVAIWLCLPADYDAGDVEDFGRRAGVDLRRSSVRSYRATKWFGVLALRLGSRGLRCGALSQPHSRMSSAYEFSEIAWRITRG